jgi:acyl-CoA thioesterase FadM
VYAAYAEDTLSRVISYTGWSPAMFRDHNLAVRIHQFHIKYYSPALWGDHLVTRVYAIKPDPNGGNLLLETRRATDDELITQCAFHFSVESKAKREENKLPLEVQTAIDKLFCG